MLAAALHSLNARNPVTSADASGPEGKPRAAVRALWDLDFDVSILRDEESRQVPLRFFALLNFKLKIAA